MKDILNIQIKKNPDKAFIIYNNQRISYADFNYMVNNIIQNIAQDKSKYIGIKFNNKLKLLVTIMAVNRLKKIPIIYPDYPNLKEYINITNIPISIKDDDIVINKTKSKSSKITHDKNETQIVMFTSGSTGSPKACELSYNNLYQSTMLWNEIIKFNNNDCYLNHMPLTHISGISIFFRSLYHNFTMVLDNFNTSDYIEIIKNNKINIISMVPSMLNKIVAVNDIKILKDLKAIIIGGASINPQLLNFIMINNLPIYISYGMTETSSGIAGFWANKKEVYQSHKNVNISVNKTKLKISSETVMKGYMNEKEIKGIFLTNDQGKMHDKNLFSILPRKDSFVNSGGEKFSSIRIKKIIEKFKEVENCKIKIIDDKQWGQVVHAYIKLSIKSSQHNLHNKIKNRLPKYMVPKKIIIQL